MRGITHGNAPKFKCPPPVIGVTSTLIVRKLTEENSATKFLFFYNPLCRNVIEKEIQLDLINQILPDPDLS